jgi:septal ring-binding cell division protein DamX/type II secretory pathway predicted ATPase ExeA
MSVSKNNKILGEQLISHFGLKDDPFRDDIGVFFEGAQRQHNLETLRHMSTFGDMVLLITGDKGAGKTSVIKRFSQIAAEDLNIFVADILGAGASEKSPTVIQTLLELVGLGRISGETTRQGFSRLIQHLEEQFQLDGSRNVLIFDNADALPKKELQFYFSYFSQLPKESGVVAIFSGAPNLLQLARLSNVEGKEEWLHQVQLKPFGAPDMLEYLQLRLEKAGFTGLLELSENQVQHLVDIGKGLPGRINRLFSSVVLEPGALKLPQNSKSKTTSYVIAGVFSLLGLSFLVVAYQYGLLETDQQDVTESVVSNDESANKISQNDLESVRLAAQKAERLRMLDKALSESLSDSFQDSNQVDKVTLQPAESDRASETLVAANDPEKVTKLETDSVIVDQPKEQKKNQLEVSIESELNIPNAVVQEVDKRDSNADTSISKPFFKDRAWVKSQSQTAYSAQILGSYKEQTAIEFAERVSREASSIYYLETLHRGKPWFVVFYGVFPTKSDAQRAIKKAPKVIVSQQPWLRRFDGILSSYPK